MVLFYAFICKVGHFKVFFRKLENNLFYLFSKHNMSMVTESLRIPYLEGISKKKCKKPLMPSDTSAPFIHISSQRCGSRSNSVMTR